MEVSSLQPNDFVSPVARKNEGMSPNFVLKEVIVFLNTTTDASCPVGKQDLINLMWMKNNIVVTEQVFEMLSKISYLKYDSKNCTWHSQEQNGDRDKFQTFYDKLCSSTFGVLLTDELLAGSPNTSKWVWYLLEMKALYAVPSASRDKQIKCEMEIQKENLTNENSLTKVVGGILGSSYVNVNGGVQSSVGQQCDLSSNHRCSHCKILTGYIVYTSKDIAANPLDVSLRNLWESFEFREKNFSELKVGNSRALDLNQSAPNNRKRVAKSESAERAWKRLNNLHLQGQLREEEFVL